MFITLLCVTFAIALTVSLIIAKLFEPTIDRILKRIIADEISTSWLKYMKFAVYVVGISSGVRIHELEKYITAPAVKDIPVVVLTSERWILELYRTVIGTFQGIAWMLLVFFVVALVAYVIVRIFESRKIRS